VDVHDESGATIDATGDQAALGGEMLELS
jgi:hypothetical protein